MNLLRELDADVAKFVMGLRSPKHGTYIDDVCPFDGAVTTYPIPNYSTDIKSAWEVAEKLEQLGYNLFLRNLQTTVVARFMNEVTASSYYSDTAPLAICLAALKAKGKDIEKYKEL